MTCIQPPVEPSSRDSVIGGGRLAMGAGGVLAITGAATNRAVIGASVAASAPPPRQPRAVRTAAPVPPANQARQRRAERHARAFPESP